MASATVHALSTGTITIPERFFVTPADSEASRTVPSLSSLVQHHAANGERHRLVFDLGMRRDISLYPKALEAHIASRQPYSTMPDAVASLAEGNLTPADIDFIMFSHVHYDHVGYPKDFDSKSTRFIVGPGALDLLSGKIKLDIGAHCVFEPDLLPLERTIELPEPPLALESPKPLPPKSELGLDTPLIVNWSSRAIAPFEHTMDLFGDGTVIVINAPGHVHGHINLMVRTSLSPLKYVLLAGDACHDMRLFTGECEIATWTDNTGRHCCIHHDIPRARETIKRLAQAQREGIEVNVDGKVQRAEVEVVFAHNWQWEIDARKRNRFWPGQVI